jgi:hypothetical protein
MVPNLRPLEISCCRSGNTPSTISGARAPFLGLNPLASL